MIVLLMTTTSMTKPIINLIVVGTDMQCVILIEFFL